MTNNNYLLNHFLSEKCLNLNRKCMKWMNQALVYFPIHFDFQSFSFPSKISWKNSCFCFCLQTNTARWSFTCAQLSALFEHNSMKILILWSSGPTGVPYSEIDLSFPFCKNELTCKILFFDTLKNILSLRLTYFST